MLCHDRCAAGLKTPVPEMRSTATHLRHENNNRNTGSIYLRLPPLRERENIEIDGTSFVNNIDLLVGRLGLKQIGIAADKA